MRCTTLIIAIISSVISSMSLAAPAHRKDLDDSLKKLICTRAPLSPQSILSFGLSDAQIEGQLLVPRPGQIVPVEDAASRARTMARVLRYKGYTFGSCPDGSAFGVAMPAPVPMGDAMVPIASLNEHCRSWRADYAKATGGQPQQLKLQSGKLQVPKAAGIVALTCQPSKPRWQGPVLWHMFPTAQLSKKTPGRKAFQIRRSTEESLKHWVNLIRAQESVKPLKFDRHLDKQADALAIGHSLNHNRLLLESSARRLAEFDLKLVGENRVKGANVDEIIWLLWHSPRHRSLLLNEEATHMGIKVAQVGKKIFAVLTMGSQKPQPLAVKSGTSKSTSKN
jgi:uncharacterized protein YkwD